ncbi:efflux RND transporter periplasmic adaptor subunit [Lichenihabitans sp. Uapishka_5]|uniref:efflux RND transporter periplasmic adaptor subunit n=1 Tax=Lichenihabitans sp. Uapishka_5 TaxID=3037302 RepID=UPI0029E8177A|nr:efflux RND transporter periplasmic adaptor subunit [Lichenihabitans sp. Uapishka_5]MDX7950218.1 efflux RND transporter periplasmic adaptor subunit [Lichenihabitans sp. Uapishka_5]
MRPRHLIPAVVLLAVITAPLVPRTLFFRGATGADIARAETAPGAPPAMPVPVTAVIKANLPVTLDYAARTESLRAITLQAKVSAYLTEQPAQDGADVKAGALLYRLDPRDFQVALDQATAQVQRDTASLEYQQSAFQRGDSLTKNGWLAKDSFDERTSTLHQAEAALAASKAALRGAQLNLDYAQIHAPFPGRLGRNQAPVGTLVGAGTTVLNTLVQLDPIYVTFNPSETDLGAIVAAKHGGTVEITVDVPGRADVPPHKGELTFIDNSVDRATGTVVARATIANADLSLLPGQYVRAQVHVRDMPDALLVPQAAIGSSQLGKFVFTVSPTSAVEQKIVTLGPAKGDQVAVLTGLSATDQVITGNLQKIGPGMPVAPMPAAAGKP